MIKVKIKIVGIGMDGDKTLTNEAKTAIENADVLIGANRVLEPFSELHKRTFSSWRPEEICDFLSGNKFENAAILVSGDCGFFSAAQTLSELFPNAETEIISGISTPVYFCAKIKKPWQSMKFVSLHGAEANVVRHVCENEHCFFLLGGSVTPSEICRKLCEYNMEKTQVYIGENLAYPSEKIYIGEAAEFTKIECGSLCVLVTENQNFERAKPIGIPDEKFLRGKVPMTKSEVRAAVISKLEISENSTCWDIGSGTGSVSVEMALQCASGTVCAIEKKAEAAELTRQNCKKFGCDNVRIYTGTAPEILEELPAPDRAFIGGSGRKISEIIGVIFRKNPRCKIVATAVSLETLQECTNALNAHGISAPEITQIAVTRTERVGEHTMLRAENPVFIIKGAPK